jgi:signal transduction histidine kinase
VLAIGGLGSLSLYRKIATFQPLGFAPESARASAGSTASPESGVGIAVERASASGPLRAGDRLILLNGIELHDVASFRHLVARQAKSTLLVQRDGALLAVEYERPALRIDFSYLALAFGGIAYLLVGFYTLVRRPHPESWLFFAWCSASAILGIFSPGLTGQPDRLEQLLYAIEQFARLLLPPLTVHLFLVFPATGPTRSPAMRFAVAFLYLPAAFLAAIHFDLLATGGRWFTGNVTREALALLDRIDIVHLACAALAALVLLWLRRHEGDAEERRQRLWVRAGLAAGYLPFFVLYGLPWLLGATPGDWLRTAAVLPLTCVPLAFAYAILRHRLWDLGWIVRDASVYTLTLLLGALGFSLANLAIGRGVPAELGLVRNLLTFLAGVSIAATLAPTRRTLAVAFERLHYRHVFGKRRALVDFGHELLHERDLDALCAALIDRVQEGLEVERANLYVMQGSSLFLVRPHADLPSQVGPETLPEHLWSATVTPIPTPGFLGSHGAWERFFLAGYRYAFPLTVRQVRVGLLLAGYRPDAQPLSSEDTEIARGLLDRAALAIENAQLVDQLHRQLDETVRLREFNEGVIESSPAGIAVLDAEHRVVSANLAFAAIVGRERRALPGVALADLLPIDPLPDAGAGLVDVSYCTLSDGRERYLQLGVSALGAGTPGAVVLVAQDATERVSIEAQLREKDRLATLGALAAGVAHEVNTPITGISSYAQMLLAETAESDPRYELLQKVERQTFRASRIVNSLLDFARDRGAETRPLELPALLAECCELLRERLAQRSARLEWRAPETSFSVLGNDGQLQQVFTNLILNAAEAVAGRPDGYVRVSARVEREHALVTVEDNGRGMSAAVLERIFQPFFSTRVAQGGTGLGLSVTRNIVRQHGGQIHVDSEPGRGARFVVELPLVGKSRAA